MKAPTLLSTVLGFICGVCATGPMSAAMVALHRRLPEKEKYPLPPQEITEKILPDHADSVNHSILTWLAHFGYGGAAGALYANTPLSLPPLVKGPLFGIVLWVASYFGLLPALGILSRADQHPFRRNLLMIVVHVVWGGFTAWLLSSLLGDHTKQSPAFQKSRSRAKKFPCPRTVEDSGR